MFSLVCFWLLWTIEDRCQRTDDRGQMAKDRGQRTEVR
ncbi:hypothetical protein D1AOALGA4SA_388 [Olavius algarvensis Delta 1 endosymbiont]|nr:hypothetical protein D1AOALGA4SA_388 [Olavius algarvensis Delta 1 endosymbiont]